MGKKEDMNIMVVPTNILFDEGRYFEGFKPAYELDFESIILANYSFMRRGHPEIPGSGAEADPSHRQPIGYAIIVNPKLNLVYAYQRSSDAEHAHESRLHGKWSWGVGGHIERVDVGEQSDNSNPIHKSMLREVLEEVTINGSISTKVLGYISDTDSVGLVHIGILYLIETDATVVEPNSNESKVGRLHTIDELESIIASPDCQVEGWSRIAIQPLHQYFNEIS